MHLNSYFGYILPLFGIIRRTDYNDTICKGFWSNVQSFGPVLRACSFRVIFFVYSVRVLSLKVIIS